MLVWVPVWTLKRALVQVLGSVLVSGPGWAPLVQVLVSACVPALVRVLVLVLVQGWQPRRGEQHRLAPGSGWIQDPQLMWSSSGSLQSEVEVTTTGSGYRRSQRSEKHWSRCWSCLALSRRNRRPWWRPSPQKARRSRPHGSPPGPSRPARGPSRSPRQRARTDRTSAWRRWNRSRVRRSGRRVPDRPSPASRPWPAFDPVMAPPAPASAPGG